MDFLGSNYLLDTDVAVAVYEKIKNLPILDPHSHVNPKRIVENEGWDDIWEMEGKMDHYVWSLMRNRGISERKITGDAPNRRKWKALANIFPMVAGNPTYEWIHLDLKRRFRIDKPLSSETEEEIWKKTSDILERESMRPRELLEEMNVEVLCSTDSPLSKLKYHKKAKKELRETKLLPTWRPDQVLDFGAGAWQKFVNKLEKRTGISTSDLDGLIDALWMTHDYFDEVGCVASDHGVQEIISKSVKKNKAQEIYDKLISGRNLSGEEKTKLRSFLLEKFGEMNAEKDWVTQLHLGAVRNYREKLYEIIGPDAGGDISTHNVSYAEGLKYYLNKFDEQLEIVIYCMDPTHFPTVATISRAFPNVNIGAPWWFNDSPFGIEKLLKYSGTVDLLSNFAGMVSDSRKLISFGSRFEVFRRSLSNLIGGLVKKGQVPRDVGIDLASYISWKRTNELFNF